MKSQAFAILCLAVMLIPLLGCENTTTQTPPNVEPNVEPDVEVPAGPKRVSADQLPDVDEYLGVALDDGRIKIAPPTGWDRGSRSQKYLALFLQSREVQIPRVVVKADVSPLLVPISRVTEENRDEFVQAVTDHLNLTEVSLLEPPIPIFLGNNCFARYVRSAKYQNASVERQMLVTVFDSRMYTVELPVYRKQLFPKTRDVSYSVAAALQFIEKEAPVEPPPADPDSTADPASEKTDCPSSETDEDSEGM